MPQPGVRLGVDFGTSNTVAVVRWADGRSRPLLFDGSPLLPSAVYAEPGGAIVVGRDAVHNARLEPARFEPNPKRRIDDGTVLLGDRELPVKDLIAAVLRRVLDEWRRTVGDTVPDATVTFPASWGATRRLTVADAAAVAGLGRVRLVPEPVAAAAYFTQVLGRDVPIGSVVVVHDFGAGTFDASVVARTSSGFEVLAVDGRDDIGGVDVDDAIVAHIGTICAERDPAAWQRLISPSTVEERRARRLLWDDVRVAKERLSRQPAADLTVPLVNVDIHLNREELEGLAKPLLEQTVRVTQGVMRWAQLAEGRLAGVFLVGGSSRIPLVATLLHRALGEAPVVIEQPELVVAEGSMLTGAAAIPVTAAPAPGPATGPMPKVDAAGYAVPVSAPPAPPTSAHPVSANPISAPPVSARAASTSPVSAPPASAPPVSAPPVSGAPVSGAPVSGAPASGAPVSGAPISSPPNRSAGRVFVSGGVPTGPVSPAEPATRYDEFGVPVVPGSYLPLPSAARPSAAQPAWSSGQRPPAALQRESSGAVARALLTLLVVLLLVATPIVAGYVAYFLTTSEWPPPVDGWIGTAGN